MTVRRSLVVLFSFITLMLGHATVHAHSVLLASTPGSEQTVAAPERLALQFNEGVRMLRVSVTDADNTDIEIGFSPNATAQEELEWELPTLAPGDYAVEWTLIGQDGHTVNGGITFTVDPDGDAQNGLMSHEDDHHHHDHGGHSH